MDKPFIKIAGVDHQMESVGDDAVSYMDRSGIPITFRNFEGVNMPTLFPLNMLKKLKDFEFRPDDVYLPGYPRTGSNWVNEQIWMLLRGKAETIPEIKPQLELLLDQLTSKPSPRVINAHMPMSKYPGDLAAKKCKIVYTLRDPRDAAVSLYKLHTYNQQAETSYKGTVENFWYLFLEGKVDGNGLLQHWLDAENFSREHPDIPFYFHVYEDALLNPVESVQKLSDFLGLSRNDDLCRAIADKCEFSKLREDKKPFTLEIGGESVLFRQGKAGDWRNYFTEEMLEEYYKVYEEKMSSSKFYKLYARKD